MTVDYNCSLGCILLAFRFWRNFFFLYDCSRSFISKNIIIVSIRALAWTVGRLGFLILNTEIISFKIIFVLRNFFNESHVDEFVDLLFLVFSPIIDGSLWTCFHFFSRFRLSLNLLFRAWLWSSLSLFFLLIFLLFQLFLMLLFVVVFQKLLLMSFELIFSQLFYIVVLILDFFNELFIDFFALDSTLKIAITVPIRILFTFMINRSECSNLSFSWSFAHDCQISIE